MVNGCEPKSNSRLISVWMFVGCFSSFELGFEFKFCESVLVWLLVVAMCVCGPCVHFGCRVIVRQVSYGRRFGGSVRVAVGYVRGFGRVSGLCGLSSLQGSMGVLVWWWTSLVWCAYVLLQVLGFGAWVLAAGFLVAGSGGFVAGFEEWLRWLCGVFVARLGCVWTVLVVDVCCRFWGLFGCVWLKGV
ncbi:hypothetical protein Droror1_Dr00015210 [Drosera rotundifolia]